MFSILSPFWQLPYRVQNEPKLESKYVREYQYALLSSGGEAIAVALDMKPFPYSHYRHYRDAKGAYDNRDFRKELRKAVISKEVSVTPVVEAKCHFFRGDPEYEVLKSVAQESACWDCLY